MAGATWRCCRRCCCSSCCSALSSKHRRLRDQGMSATFSRSISVAASYRAGLASTDDPASVRPIGEWPAPPTREAFLAMLEGQLAEAWRRPLGTGHSGTGSSARRAAGSPTSPTSTASTLRARFPGVEVALGNDAHIALLAEVMRGAAAGLSDAMLVAIGTGIGSAVLAEAISSTARAAARAPSAGRPPTSPPGDGRSGWLERSAPDARSILAAATWA